MGVMILTIRLNSIEYSKYIMPVVVVMCTWGEGHINDLKKSVK